ncbi:MAG TPA: MMPL family transporter [Candidatus Brocadiia bacterium]|nr:MMPL family transporter [Candidatus Brocadiia bacterium]
MNPGHKMVVYAVKRPWKMTAAMAAMALVLGLAAALPTISPQAFSFLHPVNVDTDPENMLPADQPERVFHDEMNKEMAIHDMVVVGIVNEKHPDGVFNPESLGRVFELTQFAKTLTWPSEENPGEKVGVIEVDLIAPSTVDNMEQAGPGTVRFEWLMQAPPKTAEEARAIRDKAKRIPFLNGTLVSEDGKALCIYLPLTSKKLSHRVYQKLNEKIAGFGGDDQFHITGLPVAEDTFGVEMFKQMAVSAPVAMLIIFILMMVFFRKLMLVISPMIVAVVSAICTMGLLVATGNTVHIMSSMIPIFIMPIAVLDAVHILSEFFDRFQETRDREKTIVTVMDILFMPMLYTSLTTAVGFGSLALTPIPPVQVFGIFVAFGVMVAWVWTILFIPAYVMLLPARSLDNFGLAQTGENEEHASYLGRMLPKLGIATVRHARAIMLGVAILTTIAIYGITKIQINDNPTRWFNAKHPIRVADKVLNSHFGGTYMGYLALEAGGGQDVDVALFARGVLERISKRRAEIGDDVDSAGKAFSALSAKAVELAPKAKSATGLLDELKAFGQTQYDEAPDAELDAWDEALLFIDAERDRGEVFKQPEVLAYMNRLQEALLETKVVGKSNSLADIVKTVYRELLTGEEKDYRIPETAAGVAQCLITYQNSHRPQDLWHFVTPDYRKANLWIQLKSGDNRDMSRVERAVAKFFAENPPPAVLNHHWFGLTHINVIWQEKMVSGMMQSFLGSFLCVFLMMTLLYRSALWGFLCMVPLTVTIGLIYGVIGLIGKDYDMPVAVLSSLSLGLAVDYSIHFLSRTRELYPRYGSMSAAIGTIFGEPARAITRNIIVIGVGFLPLVLAPLVPYKTVGVLIAAILFAAGFGTLIILPAAMALVEKLMFPKTEVCCFVCKCNTCILTAASAVALVAVNVQSFIAIGWTTLTWISIAATVILAAICYYASHREKCLIARDGTIEEKKDENSG